MWALFLALLDTFGGLFGALFEDFLVGLGVFFYRFWEGSGEDLGRVFGGFPGIFVMKFVVDGRFRKKVFFYPFRRFFFLIRF